MPSLDSSYYSSVSLTPELVATETDGLNNWTEHSFPVTWSGSFVITNWWVLSFQFPWSVDAENHPLAPERPFTRAADSIAGMAAFPFTLTLNTTATTLAGLSSARWTRYGLYQPAGAIFSASNPVSTVDTNLYRLTLVDNALLTDYLVFNGSTYDLVFEFQFQTAYSLGSGRSVNGAYSALTNHPAWNGRLQFWSWHTATSLDIAGVTLAGQTQRFHTGAWDPPGRTRTRAVHDFKTGEPYWSHTAVEDGYLENTRLHAANWDPKDPGVTFVPNPNERRVDDEIGRLE